MSKITKVTKNENLFKNISILTNILLENSEYKIKLFNDSDFNNNVKYRLFNYFLKNPKALRYINERLNNFYTFVSYNQEEWVETFQTICSISGIKSKSQLRISKFRKLDQEKFIDNIKKYNDDLNVNEMRELYKLYFNGTIVDEDLLLEKIQQKNEDLKNSISYEDVISFDKKEKLQLSKEMDNLKNKFFKFIETRSECKECKLYNNEKEFIETNMETKQKADIFIIFNNEDGEFKFKIKNEIKRLIQNYDVTYVMVNSFPCQYDNKLYENKETKEIIQKCNPVMEQLLSVFNPDYIISFGKNSKDILGIKGTISKIQGQFISKKYMVLNETSKIKNGTQSGDAYAKFLKSFQNLLYERSKRKSISRSVLNIDKNKFREDLTLFDIKILENKVIYIMINKEGKKEYITEEISYPIYIKNGSYQSCQYIDDDVDSYAIITEKEKNELVRTLRNNIKSFI